MKKCTFLIFISLLSIISLAGQTRKPYLKNLKEWHVDATNGSDRNGTGSIIKPFKSINALLAVNKKFPKFVGSGDTVYLAAGNYNSKPLVVDVANLKIIGTLNRNGVSKSILGAVEITADGVTIADCLFFDKGLTLRGTKGVSINKNLFLGTTKESLRLIGASKNNIRNNRFESATKSCIVIFHDSKQPSSENRFQGNFFTHHPTKETDQILMVNKGSKKLSSSLISAENRFIECVFQETEKGLLKQVISDGSGLRTVVDRSYSLMFEDCYFKKADRRLPFINFVIINEAPKLNWYWDDVINDTWVVSNKNYALTGSKDNGYNPAIRFVDSDKNGHIFETSYPKSIRQFEESLLSDRVNNTPIVSNTITDIAVYENAANYKVNLFDVFEDTETRDEALKFTVKSDAKLLRSEINDGILTLDFAKDAIGDALVTVTATDDDSFNPLSAEESFHFVVVEVVDNPLTKRSDWYIDSKKGDDINGDGSKSAPFNTIERLLSLYAKQPGLKKAGNTIHLGEGVYGPNLLKINIPGLIIKGTLDNNGKPKTILGKTIISANGVQLKNCVFQDASLTLFNVDNVFISNNVFSGKIDISLSLLGASNNTIQNNEFRSALHDCVQIYWDPDSGRSSKDNVFFRNYFTHRPDGITHRIVRVEWAVGDNNSISARNRFVECAFKETSSGNLLRVVDDECTWWMVADHGYSLIFEDCYFKKANRAEPFREFVIVEGYPSYTWRWDELTNDKWISTNKHWGLTGDHNGWKHRPRIQFVDKNNNGRSLEKSYYAGLLPVDKISR